nr:hypothetical protein Iba_chr06aCG13190 [Ipomoea batatas]
MPKVPNSRENRQKSHFTWFNPLTHCHFTEQQQSFIELARPCVPINNARPRNHILLRHRIENSLSKPKLAPLDKPSNQHIPSHTIPSRHFVEHILGFHKTPAIRSSFNEERVSEAIKEEPGSQSALQMLKEEKSFLGEGTKGVVAENRVPKRGRAGRQQLLRAFFLVPMALPAISQ